MNHHAKNLIGCLSTLGLLLAHADAMAGAFPAIGYISYGPSTPVPALSGAMLAVLAFLFAVLAFRALRAHPGGKPPASLLALGVLALAAASGNQIIQSVQATVIPNIVLFINASGGSVSVSTGVNQVTNSTGQPQHINHIGISSPYYPVIPTTPFSPACAVGMVLQNQASCYIEILGGTG